MKSEYLSVRSLRGHEGVATSRVIVAAAELSRLLAQEEHLDTAFPCAVAAVSGVSGQSVQVAAARLLNLPPAERAMVLDAGLQGMSRLFGSDDIALRFFKQQGLPCVKFGFERNGVPCEEDLLSACNRSALLAAKAVRYGGDAETAYVDFMKSAQRTLDQAALDGALPASEARAVRTQIEEAAYVGRSAKERDQIVSLQLRATEEYSASARDMIFSRYANALGPTKVADRTAAAPSISH